MSMRISECGVRCQKIWCSYSALRVTFRIKKCQGDHGKCRADYRCCLPALAGFVSPQSMGPGEWNVGQARRGFKGKIHSDQKLQASSLKLQGRIKLQARNSGVAVQQVLKLGVWSFSGLAAP